MHREIERFDPTLPIGEAATPPSSWYTEPSMLELERRAVFATTWQAVARTDQLRRTGDYVAGDSVGEPFVVVRQGDGDLRAFWNVCRHHAACVAQGEGNADRLTCPYHGWVYDLDGRLRSAPRMAGVARFDRAGLGLVPMQAATWGPLVFVRARAGGPPLVDGLRPLDGRMDLEHLRFHCRRTYELACNWKVFVDNYLDGGYHVEWLHRGLADQLDLDGYRTEIDGVVSIQSCAAGCGQTDGSDVDFRDRVGGGATYAFVYPNLMINRYGPILDTNRVVPLGPSRTLVVFDYWFEADRLADREFVERCLAASDRVQQEDVAVCESVQRGLASSAFDTGRYAPRLEHAAYHFHRLLASDLAAAAAG